jgi:hypothetical protein
MRPLIWPNEMAKRKKNPAELVVMAANPAELVVMGANPHRKKNPGDLEGASQMYEDFHGEPGKHVDTYQEPTPRPMTLAQLGALVELAVKRPMGWKWGIFDFKGRGIQVAANSSGTQIYFIGGNQKISRGELTHLGADNSKEFIDLGEVMSIAYRARKAQVNGIASDYEHKFGDMSGIRPRLIYDRTGPSPRIKLAGGDYIAKIEGIVN